MLISLQAVNGFHKQFDAVIREGREAALAQPIVTLLGEERFCGLRAEGMGLSAMRQIDTTQDVLFQEHSHFH